MVYFRWYLVNPQVQLVQKMYVKRGYKVLKAKLRAAEDDPRLTKKNNVNCGIRKKQARPQFSNYHFHKVLQFAIEGLSLKSLLHVFQV